METHVSFSFINTLFEKAERAGRSFLFEYEVYDLIQNAGSETPPAYRFLPKNERLKKEDLDSVPGEKAVVKIVSPLILHKSDVGGVQIVNKTLEDILSALRRMYSDIPGTFAEMVRLGKLDLAEGLQENTGEELKRHISDSIEGVIICQYMVPDSREFGNELLVSLRRTREFGMILSAGLGGTDTELYAKRFRKGQAVVAASTEMVSGEDFFNLFRSTISYRKLAGLTRGGKRIVTDEQLLECFAALIELGCFFSPLNPGAPYVIDELEINPFAFSNYLMLPLDGLCRFSRPPKGKHAGRPSANIDKLLHPGSIAIVGASAKGMNIGRIILENILKMGFPREDLFLVHPSFQHLDGVRTVTELLSIPKKVDLLILAVNSSAIPELLEQVVEHGRAHSVVLVPGGFGEDDASANDKRDELLARIEQMRREKSGGPVILGGNSLGILSHPGGYDGIFIPESKLPKSRGRYLRKSALVSQSGAYMITRMSKLSFLDPAYAVSIGNQIDLTAADFLRFFNKKEELETIAFYVEGFADLDGLAFSQAVRESIAAGKEIIFYKAGRTAEGKTAMTGHTASIAGDYMVCESCISQAGAFVAETFSDFEGLLRLSRALHGREINGNRLAAVSNAGYEAVGIADNILGEDYSLEMVQFQENTVKKMDMLINNAGLQQLVTIANPMDVTPMATEDVYTGIIKSLLDDANIDLVVIAIVPLTPILHTLPDEHIADDGASHGKGLVAGIAALNAQTVKPLVMVVDSGPLYDHIANGLEESGLAVFRSADQAVRVLGKYVQTRLFIQHKA
ncbi:acetate--CoA ligase family protein [Desulfopila inferna]|nr:acetate--CoA ligase family protein [Desulfopila inferna]MBM9604892.1 acetate--CoA ligase family protein [Desulfopila inferna]